MADSRQNPNDPKSTGMLAAADKPRGLRRELSSPVEAIKRMSDEVDRTFDRVLTGWGFPSLFPHLRPWTSDEERTSLWTPRIEVFQKDDKFIVRAELPGLKKDDVEVNITDDAISIQGQRRDEHEGQERGFYHSERSYGSFYRAIPLPDGVMGDKAEASFENGVLEIRIPSAPAEARKGRKVEIRDKS